VEESDQGQTPIDRTGKKKKKKKKTGGSGWTSGSYQMVFPKMGKKGGNQLLHGSDSFIVKSSSVFRGNTDRQEDFKMSQLFEGGGWDSVISAAKFEKNEIRSSYSSFGGTGQ